MHDSDAPLVLSRRQACTAGFRQLTSFLAQSSTFYDNFPLQTTATGLYAYVSLYQTANEWPVCSNVKIIFMWLITFHNNNAFTKLSLLGKDHLNYHPPQHYIDKTSMQTQNTILRTIRQSNTQTTDHSTQLTILYTVHGKAIIRGIPICQCVYAKLFNQLSFSFHIYI